MTRLSKVPASSQRFGLPEAFKFLGEGPTYREIGLVVDLLHKSGVEQLDYDEDLQELAIENGSSAIVALDVHSSFYFGVEALSAGPLAGR